MLMLRRLSDHPWFSPLVGQMKNNFNFSGHYILLQNMLIQSHLSKKKKNHTWEISAAMHA